MWIDRRNRWRYVVFDREICSLRLLISPSKTAHFYKFLSISIYFFLFLFILFPVFSAKLTVSDSLIVKRTLYLVPQSSAPSNPQAGQIYYDNSEDAVKYWDGEKWVSLSGGEDKSVATVIVAASDSLDTYDDGGTKKNDRADLTCQGTNDETIIQDAIDNYLSSGGGAVYLLEGTYWVSNSINVPSNVTIIGQGAGTVISIMDSSSLNTGVIVNSDRISGNSRILIKNLRIDGNKDNNTNNNQKGIYFEKVTESLIANLWIENTKGRGIRFNSSCDNNIISGNTVQSADNGGIMLSGANNIISENILKFNRSNNYDISLLSSSNGNIVSGNYIELARGSGIGAQFSPRNIFIGNIIISSVYGISFNSRCTVVGNNVQLNGATPTGIISNQRPSNTLISGNIIQSGEGVCLISTNNNNISGNIIFPGAQWGGISFEGLSSTNNLISSNYIYKSSGNGVTYGINISNTSSGHYLASNFIGGSGFTQFIKDLGTSIYYTQKEKITIERQEVSLSSTPATLEVATTPRGYVFFNTGGSNILLGDPANNIDAIADGKAIGDTLILEGPSSGSVTVKNEANVLLNGGGDFTLSAEDTLTLLWNGEDWVEIAHSDN